MTISSKKIVAAVVGFGLALSVFAGASFASAQTAMSLTDLVNLFISLGIISPDKAAAAKAAVTSTASVSFTRDLTVGSSGADVTALQNVLGVSPATGYFGSITKAAVQQYQASKGIPSTGYVGPLTRAELNKGSSAVVPTVPGQTPIVNTGVEGTLTATKSSISNSTVREGETMKNVLAFRLEAKLSDINVQRVKLDLGISTTIYTKVFRTMYLTDDTGRVLAQADLNSNTVVKDGDRYALTLGGFSYTIPRNSSRTLFVRADVYSSIKDADQFTRTIRLFGTSGNAVRGVDGAGIDQYAGDNSISQNLGVGVTVAESATLQLSTNSANFKASEVIASSGADSDEIDGVNVLAFDLRAEKDAMLVTEIKATVAKTGTGNATATRAHLFEGSTPVKSEDIHTSTGVVTFGDLEIEIAKDTTKTFTLKVDIINANGTASVITASIAGGNIVAENTLGTERAVTGTATGEQFTVRNVGPVFALSGVTTGSVTRAADLIATSSATFVYNLNVTARGGNISFGPSGSGESFVSGVQLYRNEVAVSVPADTMTVEAFYGVPTSGVTASGSSFILSRNNSVNIPVSVQVRAHSTAPQGNYSVGLTGLKWGVDYAATTTSTFMANQSAWRSANVTLP